MKYIEGSGEAFQVRLDMDNLSDETLFSVANQVHAATSGENEAEPADDTRTLHVETQGIDTTIELVGDIERIQKGVDSKLGARGYTVRELGAYSMRPAALEIVKTSQEKAVPSYVNPRKKLSAEAQLDAAFVTWERLGFKRPSIDDDLARSIEARAAERPDLRVVPAPHLELPGNKYWGRRAASPRLAVDPAQSHDRHGLGVQSVLENRLSLFGKDQPYPYSRLYSGGDDGNYWAYKLFDGSIGDSDEYERQMHAEGFMASGGKNNAWTFPMLSLEPSPVVKSRQEDAFNLLHPATSPEALTFIALARLLAGHETDRSSETMANLFIFTGDNTMKQSIYAGWDQEEHLVIVGGDFIKRNGRPRKPSKPTTHLGLPPTSPVNNAS